MDQVRDRMEVKLEHDVRPVGFSRFDADIENCGDFLVALALR